MLISSYEHSVDVKGRVFVPAKWREDLGETVAVIRGLLERDSEAKCLFGMSESELNRLIDRIKQIAISDVEAQSALRLILANACICEVDKQGRILISASLREYAGIGEDAVLVGVGTKIEIWSKANWDKYNDVYPAPTDDMLEKLRKLGV